MNINLDENTIKQIALHITDKYIDEEDRYTSIESYSEKYLKTFIDVMTSLQNTLTKSKEQPKQNVKKI